MKVYLFINNYKTVLRIGNLILRKDYYNYYGNYYETLALKGIKDYKSALSIANKMLTLYPTSVLFLNFVKGIYYLKKKITKKIKIN